MIDLKSDTVTCPTPGMLDAMMGARVGDDVFGEDPTVNALEEKAAALFGMEAAVFCPSGTMTNQIALNVHLNQGDEVICHEYSHIYKYEGGGIAANSGASVRLVSGDRGFFTANNVVENINPDDAHFPITKLVSLENTCNKGGGSCWNLEAIKSIYTVCKNNNLAMHLDGARLFNALVARGENATDYGQLFDTISICLSKGLAAPVGSLLLGSANTIKQARRVRKRFGGGMRQAGFLAAAGIYALDHHVDRLAQDHDKAKTLGTELANLSFVEEVLPIETNIVVFRINNAWDNDRFLSVLDERGILAVGFGPNTIRLVTHLDFSNDMLTETIAALKSI